MTDSDFMQEAILEAKRVPDVPFGCVIVDTATGEVVARGYNQTSEDVTLHGEIDAIRKAHGKLKEGAIYTLYTTAEPCPMCMGAIFWAGITRIVFGTSIETLINKGWRQIPIPASEISSRTPKWKCKVVGGVLASECDAMFVARL
jgi:tRNA(adenine34) deaminase